MFTLLRDLAFTLTIEPKMKKLQELLPEAKIYPTGSRYVCNPPVMTTDIDFLVWSLDPMCWVRITNAGFKQPHDFQNYESDISNKWPFTTWRKGQR